MSAAPASSTLFERVVAECGLSAIFARTSVRNAFDRAGIQNPERIGSGELRRAMPELQSTVSGFLTQTQAAAAMARLQRLAQGG